MAVQHHGDVVLQQRAPLPTRGRAEKDQELEKLVTESCWITFAHGWAIRSWPRCGAPHQMAVVSVTHCSHEFMVYGNKAGGWSQAAGRAIAPGRGVQQGSCSRKALRC